MIIAKIHQMKSKNTKSLSVLMIAIIATSLRLMGILSRPIWFDEALSMSYSQRMPSEIIFSIVGNSQGVAAIVHPPSYFLALWAWTKLFGDSISDARLFSIVAGVLSVVVVFFFLDSLFGEWKLAAACLFLFACAPFQVHYSQEIRMYSWMGLIMLCATYFFWKGLQSHKLKWTPVFIERALLLCAGMLILWIACSLITVNLPKIIQFTSISLLIIGFSIGNYEHVPYSGFPYGPFEEIAKIFRKEMSADTIIIHSNKLNMIPAYYSEKTLPQIHITDQSGGSTDTLAPETRSVLEIPSSANIQTAASDYTHIWLGILHKAIDESQAIKYLQYEK
jgi:hypothetical protein